MFFTIVLRKHFVSSVERKATPAQEVSLYRIDGILNNEINLRLDRDLLNRGDYAAFQQSGVSSAGRCISATWGHRSADWREDALWTTYLPIHHRVLSLSLRSFKISIPFVPNTLKECATEVQRIVAQSEDIRV